MFASQAKDRAHPLPWMIAVLVFAVGVAASLWANYQLSRQAVYIWEESAEQAAQWLSSSMLEWLEESYSSLSGMAAVFESSSKVTEEEFLNAFEAIEFRATTFFLDSIAVAQREEKPESSSGWNVSHASDQFGVFSKEDLQLDRGNWRDVLIAAEARPGRIVLGSPITQTNGIVELPIALISKSPQGTIAVLGIVNMTSLIEGLGQVHMPKGVSVAIYGRFPNASDRGQMVTVVPIDTSGFRQVLATRTISGNAEIIARWHFSDAFNGGPDERLSELALWAGIIISLLIAGVIAILIARNQEIRKRVDERTAALAESMKDLEEAQHLASIGNWILDLKTNELTWSNEIYRIFGIDKEKFGASYEAFLDAIHPDDRDYVDENYRGALEGKFPYDIEHRIIRKKDGEVRWVHERCVHQRDEFGTVLRSDGTVQDITDRKRMERLMVQNEKMVSVGGLAAGMAHELNSPLGGILQGLQNIHRRLSPDLDKNKIVAQELGIDLMKIDTYFDQRGITNFLDGIRKSGERASVIVNNMLQFALKAESKLYPENLDQLVDQALELAAVDYDLKTKYGFRGIKIVRKYDSNLPQVDCIASEIGQVLLNIIRNAAQALFTLEGEAEPRITIRTLKKNEMACIEVEDNGPGMDEEIRKHVFDPFFTTRPVGEGAGLGLSVCYFIVTQEHKGKLSVDSKLGQGTKFTVCLPCK